MFEYIGWRKKILTFILKIKVHLKKCFINL